MPLITIAAASPDRQISTKARIAAEISRLSSNLLHKDPKVTAVIVTSVDPDDWFCGGRSLTGRLARQSERRTWQAPLLARAESQCASRPARRPCPSRR